MNRYTIMSDEGEYQPHSNGQVLKNRLGITLADDMAIAETELLLELYKKILNVLPEELSIQTLMDWHRWWLGNIYEWAGQIRSVNMSKPDIHFAAAAQIPKLFDRFEVQYLTKYKELAGMSREALIHFFAEAHVEFILIHPFREGNGRISRLLLDVMAVKAGLPTLDYSLWEEHKEFYFKAIQAGRDGDYQHLKRLMADIFPRA